MFVLLLLLLLVMLIQLVTCNCFPDVVVVCLFVVVVDAVFALLTSP